MTVSFFFITGEVVFSCMQARAVGRIFTSLEKQFHCEKPKHKRFARPSIYMNYRGAMYIFLDASKFLLQKKMKFVFVLPSL